MNSACLVLRHTSPGCMSSLMGPDEVLAQRGQRPEPRATFPRHALRPEFLRDR